MDNIQTNTRLTPSHCIIVYKTKDNREFYLERRELKQLNGQYNIMAPVPLDENIFRNIAKAFAKNTGFDMQFGGLIDEHILYASSAGGRTAVIWYRPSQKRTLNFSASLNINTESVVNIPATLYAVVNKELFVYALMKSERPGLKTKLYNAPFFNIYADGRVCLGTAPVGTHKARTFALEAERFERGFYMAEQNGGQSGNNCKTPLQTLWKKLIRSKAVFPAATELIQHTKYKTLADLMDKLLGEDIDQYTDEDGY